jgi:hypothetical protein
MIPKPRVRIPVGTRSIEIDTSIQLTENIRRGTISSKHKFQIPDIGDSGNTNFILKIRSSDSAEVRWWRVKAGICEGATEACITIRTITSRNHDMASSLSGLKYFDGAPTIFFPSQ